jgi:hypothetical protein
MSSIGEEIVKEMARVRELLPLYDAVPAGIFAATMMRAALDKAAKALAEGDIVQIILSYEDLKGFDA